MLDAALMIAAENGLEALTIGTVGRAASAPKSLVLYHFGSRDKLVSSAVDHAAARVQAARRDAMDSAGSDPREQLRAWVSAVFTSVDVVQGWCFVTQVTTRMAPIDGLDRICSMVAAERGALAELLERGNDDFCWQVPNSESMASTLLALIDGLALGFLRTGYDADLDKAAATCRRAVFDLLVR